jgi:ribokinase
MCSVGAYTVDVYIFTSHLPSVGESVMADEIARSHGGKAANQAVAAARLGRSVRLISAVGEDEAGASACTVLEEYGVDIGGVSVVNGGATGTSFVTASRSGAHTIVTFGGALEQLDKRMIQKELSGTDCSTLLVQNEVPTEATLAACEFAQHAGARVVVNPSPIGELDVHSDLFRFADVVVVNAVEAAMLTGQSACGVEVSLTAVGELARALGCGQVVMTAGGEGSAVYEWGRETWVEAPTVSVVDTSGAGDAFLGGLAAGLETGASLVSAVESAARLASASVMRRYCFPSYVTYEEIDDRLET